MNKKEILKRDGMILVRTTIVGNKIYEGKYFIDKEDGIKRQINGKTFSSLASKLKRVKILLNGVEMNKEFIPTMDDGVTEIYYSL
jgi:hypothetical protein